MSTKAYYTHEEIGKGKPGFSKTVPGIMLKNTSNPVFMAVKAVKLTKQLLPATP